MKKIISIILAGACFASCLTAGAAAAEAESLSNFERSRSYVAGTFPDVKDGDWFADYAATAYELGLVSGNAEGKFNPDGNITYAETLVLASKLHSIYHGGSGEFQMGDPWYAIYASYCIKNNIISLEPENYSEPIARGEFVDILSRALPESTMPEIRVIEDDQIPDVKTGSDYAEAIYRFYRAGILSGNNSRGTFAPDTPIKRSAVSVILSGMVYRSLRSKTPLEVSQYPDLSEQARAEDEFFKDAAILGNSLVDGLKIYSKLSSTGMKFYSGTSMSVTSAMKTRDHTLKDGSSGTVVDALCENSYGKIYIELGINEIYLAAGDFTKSYGEMVDKIRASNPDADIYIMAVTPVTKAKSDEGTFTKARVEAFNEALHELAAEKGCWYLDCYTQLCGDDGYLAEEGSWDGVHFNPSKYAEWEECIRTHYAG